MRKILILGCGGMLGKAFYGHFSKKNVVEATDIDLNEKWLKFLDVRDYDEMRKKIIDFMPDIIFHLAALTDLEFCEKNIEESYRTNTVGTENAAILAKEFSIPLVYISTAGIYDGKKELYDDYDVPNPLSHYGRSKYMGEIFIRRHLTKYFVFRAGWMMGGGKKDKKFVSKIIKQILKGKKEIYAVTDLFGTPTYTNDFANNVEKVIKTNYYGVYNMVCGGNASRYDVAKEIIKNLKLTKKIKLVPVKSDYFSKDYFAPRPDSEKLINLKLKLRKLNKMRGWKICLKEYINKNWYEKL